MADEEYQCPYLVGNTIKLNTKTLENVETVDTTISKLFEFTWSCVMLVWIACLDLHSKGEMVVKLFDRRFAEAIREHFGSNLWDQALEMLLS